MVPELSNRTPPSLPESECSEQTVTAAILQFHSLQTIEIKAGYLYDKADASSCYFSVKISSHKFDT
jgi:hypothetical protein